MARRSKYSPEFRDRSVRVARESERSIAAVAHDLGIHPETLRLQVVYPTAGRCGFSSGRGNEEHGAFAKCEPTRLE